MRKKTQYIVVNEIYKTIYCGYPQKRAWNVFETEMMKFLMEAIIGMMHLRSKWALYRDTYNELLGVQRKYGIHRKCGHCTEAFNEFVSQAEEIIQNEAYKWRETVKKENTDESENNKN